MGKSKEAEKDFSELKLGDTILEIEFAGKRYENGKVEREATPNKFMPGCFYFNAEFQSPKGEFRVYCKGKNEIYKVYQFTWMDLARRKLIKKNLQGEAADVIYYDFCNGDSSRILIEARGYQTTERKLKYLRWILMQYYGSPEYVLHGEIENIKRRRDAEEFLANPKEFKRRYTHKHTPENEAPFEMTYYEREECEATPWVEIEREVKRLQDEAESGGEKKKRGPRDPHFSNLRPYHANGEVDYSLTSLAKQINIHRNTFTKWYEKGLLAYGNYTPEKWEAAGYETAPKTRRLILKTFSGNTKVLKRDLIKFLEFTGQIEKEIIPPQNATKRNKA